MKPRILGSHEVPDGPVRILDRNTKQEQTPPEIVVHEEHITHVDQIRSHKRVAGEPEIQLRNAPTKEEFDKIKREQ